MRTSFILILILVIGIAACSKSGYKTNPTLSIKSINTIIPVNGGLEAVIKFTDKQGDLGQGTFTAIRVRTNINPPTNALADTIVGPIPGFPTHSSGEFDFTLPYNFLNETISENDTIYFKFSATDKAGNKSDTITTPQIVVLYQ